MKKKASEITEGDMIRLGKQGRTEFFGAVVKAEVVFGGRWVRITYLKISGRTEFGDYRPDELVEVENRRIVL